MEQYIKKSALVAEIGRLKEEALQKKSQCKRHGLEKIMHQISAYNKVLSFIDTLKVKEVDLEKNVRQVINLYLEAGKYYNGIIKKERDECGGSDFAIKLLNGLIDAKELGIQYVLDKLKAQKGEEV